jgi:hypothetical protein
MNARGEKIPIAWIWLIPIAGSLYWYWKYSEDVENVTKEKLNSILTFVLFLFWGYIGQAIVRVYFNEVSKLEVSKTPTVPITPQTPATPPVATS